MSQAAPKKKTPNYVKFLNSGLSVMLATCVVHPSDVVKTRMQLDEGRKGERRYKGMIDCLKKITKEEGWEVLYRSMGAGLFRQATYGAARIGVYQYLRELYANNVGGTPNLATAMAMGTVAGACGALVGTPAELCLIRMMSDGQLPPEQRRNYTGVTNALTRIVKEEGFLGLWAGGAATVIRSIIVNMVMLSSYSQFKSLYSRYINEGLSLHLTASLSSGFLTCLASMPIDCAKTRIQNMKVINGVPEFKGTIDVIVKVSKKEGIFSLWRGFFPYFMRVGPHTVLTFIFVENLNRLYQEIVLRQEGKSNL